MSPIIANAVGPLHTYPFEDEAPRRRTPTQPDPAAPLLRHLARKVEYVLSQCLNADGSWSDMPACYKRELLELARRTDKRRIASGDGNFTLDESDPDLLYATCRHCQRTFVFSASGVTWQSLHDIMRIHREKYCVPPRGGESVT